MPSITKKQLLEDVKFLAQRSMNAGTYTLYAGKIGGVTIQPDEERDYGLSSNYIVALAYGIKADKHLPGDESDLMACLRMAAKLPNHRKTKQVLNALWDAERYKELKEDAGK